MEERKRKMTDKQETERTGNLCIGHLSEFLLSGERLGKRLLRQACDLSITLSQFLLQGEQLTLKLLNHDRVDLVARLSQEK